MSAIVLWFVAVSFLPRSRAVPSGDAVVLREFICDSMPTPQCHASTIAESHGRLVAAWCSLTVHAFPVGIRCSFSRVRGR
jgi:hypothetical protein